MTQKEYQHLSTGPAQKAIVYRMLLEANGGWVIVEDMSDTAGSMRMGARIYDLRQMGISIIHNGQHIRGISAYRLAQPGEGGSHEL